ncbi:MAG: acyl-CoA thioesterase [Desulfobulbaceae bacterium]|nr:acyl-CoA thioesterase [Desulfobulbaceae bacterium]
MITGEKTSNNSIGRLEIVVPESAIDANGHVNNVQYVQWMQDAALVHSASLGWPLSRYAALGCTWFVRSHTIEYFHACYAGELIWVDTWVANFQRIKSLRKFRFFRPTDKNQLAKASTLFVFCDSKSRKPTSIPPEVLRDYPIVASAQEPK